MKILVVGAGGIGAFLGGSLSLFGQEVILINRNEIFVSAVKEKGVVIERGKKTIIASHVKAFKNMEEAIDACPNFDLVMLTVKSYDTKEAIEKISPIIAAKGWPFLTLQNGVGNEEIILNYLKPDQILSGILTMPVTVLEPGRIRLEPNKGGVGLASVSGEDDKNKWTLFFAQCGFKSKWYNDYKSLKWSKLLLNLIGNAIPAILQMPPEEVYANKEIFFLEQQMLKEAVTVAKTLGISICKLPGYNIPLLMKLLLDFPAAITHPLFKKKIGGGRGKKLPSLLIDLNSKKRDTETGMLNGAVSKGATNAGISAPVNMALTNILEEIAKNGENKFYHNPKLLLETLKNNSP